MRQYLGLLEGIYELEVINRFGCPGARPSSHLGAIGGAALASQRLATSVNVSLFPLFLCHNNMEFSPSRVHPIWILYYLFDPRGPQSLQKHQRL